MVHTSAHATEPSGTHTREGGAGTKGQLDSLRSVRGLDLDHLELVGPDLGPVPETGKARVLIAARVGSTRLIDNMPVRLGDGTAA